MLLACPLAMVLVRRPCSPRRFSIRLPCAAFCASVRRREGCVCVASCSSVSPACPPSLLHCGAHRRGSGATVDRGGLNKATHRGSAQLCSLLLTHGECTHRHRPARPSRMRWRRGAAVVLSLASGTDCTHDERGCSDARTRAHRRTRTRNCRRHPKQQQQGTRARRDRRSDPSASIAMRCGAMRRRSRMDEQTDGRVSRGEEDSHGAPRADAPHALETHTTAHRRMHRG